MRKSLFFNFIVATIALFGHSTLSANVTIQAPYLSGHQIKSLDVMACRITSTSEHSFRIKLVAQVKQSNGQVVAVLSTETFILHQGLNVFDPNSTPVNLHYVNKDIGLYEQTNSKLPSGNYSYCVQVNCQELLCGKFMNLERPIMDCVDVIVPPTTPILLANPEDEAELENTRPNFTWIPPLPEGTDPSINYEFILVELRPKQSAENGLARNRPIYRERGIPILNRFFPSELPDLELGGRYAWQVNAYLGNTRIQNSEVWEFKIKKEEDIIQPMPFVRLKTTDKEVYNAVNELKATYVNDSKETKLTYRIVSINDEDLGIVLPELSLTSGENKLLINLNDLLLEHKSKYILKVTRPDGIEYKLYFTYYYQK